VDQGIWMWETAGLAAETFRGADQEGRHELGGALIKDASWGQGRLEVTLKPPFDVILQEGQQVRRAEQDDDGGTKWAVLMRPPTLST
jgi:hypothetical protein